MIDQHSVVVVGGRRSIEQHRQKIGFGVPDAGGVFTNTVQHLFNVLGRDVFKAVLDKRRGVFHIPPDFDGRALGHVSAHSAIGTSLFVDVIASITVSYTYFKNGNIEIKSGLWMAVSSIAGAQLGALFSSQIKEGPLSAMFGIILVIAGIGLLIKSYKKKGEEKEPKAKFTKGWQQIVSSIIIGIGIGILSGLFGAGGGVMILLALIVIMSYPLHKAIGTSTLIMAELRTEVKRAKAESSKATTEYESIKAEMVKVVLGKSNMPKDVLTEVVNECRDKVIATSERLTALTAELERGNARVSEMRSELSRIRTWSEIFDDSDMEVKKMIANYIIKRVNVFKGYKLDIELNLNVQQFLNGLDSISDDKESRSAVAS